MNDSEDQPKDPLAIHGCRTLECSDGLRVGILNDVLSAYEGFEEHVQNKLKRIMFRWCGGHAMTKEMFNGNEGRTPNGTSLKAFKTFKHRMYGFETSIDGIRTFVIVDHDPAKKQDKADPKILTRAKGRVDAFGKGK